MSDRNLAQPPDAAGQVIDLAAHRARRHREQVGAVLAPTLAALCEYRRQVVEHCDRTIALLEQLELWVAGGELPVWAPHCAELYARFHREGEVSDVPNAVFDETCDELSAHYLGTVSFCEAALEELATIAVDPTRARSSAADVAARIIKAARHSAPNQDCEPPGVYEAFSDSAPAAFMPEALDA